MPTTIEPPLNSFSAVAQLLRRFGRIEVMRLRVEVLDLLGHDPRAGSQHEVVVAEPLPVLELHGVLGVSSIDAYFGDDQLHPLIEQRSLGPGELFGCSWPKVMYMKPGW